MTATTPPWHTIPPQTPASDYRAQALARQEQLTKPPGSLGRLEQLAVQLASLQGRDRPDVERASIVVFAADHGIAAAGTSAFPQAVTTEMVKNFAAGGAAISVIARQLNARLEVVDMGTLYDPGPLSNVVAVRLAPGTANACEVAAMTSTQLDAALHAGREAVQRANEHGCDIFIGGDMGIGNTATATAVACALLQLPASELTGPGTGLDAAGVARKAAIIQRALDRHADHTRTPLTALQHLGGFEIAALSGAFIASAQAGIPVLVDGFIAGCAALVAVRHLPAVRDWLIFGHRSAEPGHRHILEALLAEPLLDLGLRLGEGSGAASALPLLRLACSLHGEMATFAEAAVSGATTSGATGSDGS